ncbi:hypothetical protein BC834DRAFT_80147 [Gloeopeniophorella convolvens]|nr:hypothetical protein BC834DRAFT_80147 [Gloeopeniophorella convolvens]
MQPTGMLTFQRDFSHVALPPLQVLFRPATAFLGMIRRQLLGLAARSLPFFRFFTYLSPRLSGLSLPLFHPSRHNTFPIPAVPGTSYLVHAGDPLSIPLTSAPSLSVGYSCGVGDPPPDLGSNSSPIGATPSRPPDDHANPISVPPRHASASDGASSSSTGVRTGPVPHSKLLVPIDPSRVKRYERSGDARDSAHRIGHRIEPFQRSFDSPANRSGWDQHLHPEGARYFVCRSASTGVSPMEILTDADVTEDTIHDEIASAMERLESKTQGHRAELGDIQVVFELLDDEDAIGYYLVDHKRKTIFWADPYDVIDGALCEVSVIASRVQLGHEVEAWYWQHLSLFPCRPIKMVDVDKLEEYIFAAGLDLQTSTKSLAPYDSEELTIMLKHLTYVKGIANMERMDGMVAPIARLHSFFAHARFLHYHGEKYARLSLGQSVFGAVAGESTRPFRLLNIALFGRPRKSLKKLEPLVVDDVGTQSTLTKFLTAELDGWKTLVTQCGLFITANLAFLAVPSVINAINNNTTTTQANFALLRDGFSDVLKAGPPPDLAQQSQSWTPAQVFSSVSTIFFLVSILVNFLLREMYSGEVRGRLPEMIALHGAQRSFSGLFFRDLECLAILHGIPMAFMIWGALCATISFACWSLETRHAIVGLLWALGSVLLLSSGLLWLGVRFPGHCEDARNQMLGYVARKVLPANRGPPVDEEQARQPPTQRGQGLLRLLHGFRARADASADDEDGVPLEQLPARSIPQGPQVPPQVELPPARTSDIAPPSVHGGEGSLSRISESEPCVTVTPGSFERAVPATAPTVPQPPPAPTVHSLD